mmetsp:Transcript_24744/g.52730  ORF Transcript_24744/g.52730 Transcript_24744/m.52730 type:complete len:224 (-) Transcript_24744:186-857(-)
MRKGRGFNHWRSQSAEFVAVSPSPRKESQLQDEGDSEEDDEEEAKIECSSIIGESGSALPSGLESIGAILIPKSSVIGVIARDCKVSSSSSPLPPSVSRLTMELRFGLGANMSSSRAPISERLLYSSRSNSMSELKCVAGGPRVLQVYWRLRRWKLSPGGNFEDLPWCFRQSRADFERRGKRKSCTAVSPLKFLRFLLAPASRSRATPSTKFAATAACRGVFR